MCNCRVAGMEITRDIVLDAGAQEVWDCLTDDAALSEWLDGDAAVDARAGGRGVVTEADGTVRQLLVERADEGDTLVWTWWNPDRRDEPPSTVTFALEELEPGRTRLVVTERALQPGAMGGGGPRAWDARLARLEVTVHALACV